MAERVLVGQGRAPIVLTRPVPLSGFAARVAPSSGTADPPLQATAVALGSHVLVFLDVIAVDPPLADAVRRAAAVDADVSVIATHTHAGPCVLARGLGTYSAEAAGAVVKAAGRAVREAVARQVPCSLEWLEPVWAGVAHDRRRGQVSADARLRALRWWDEAGNLRGALVSYPCHPTSLGPLNTLLSPDYPGFLRQAVEDAWGVPCAFATGCAGARNTGHPAAASFRTGAGDAGRTLADSARVGRALAEEVLGGTWTGCADGDEVEAATASLTLRLVPLDADLDAMVADWAAQRRSEDAGLRALLDTWLAWAKAPGAGRPADWTGKVGRLRVAGVDLFQLPGEPFLAADTALTRGRRAIALGYYEDCPGYFPSEDQYELGGYEVVDAHRYYGMPAPFERGTLERLVQAASALGG